MAIKEDREGGGDGVEADDLEGGCPWGPLVGSDADIDPKAKRPWPKRGHTWEELVEMMNDGSEGALAKLIRFKDEALKYRAFRASIKGPMTDYLLAVKLRYATDPDRSTDGHIVLAEGALEQPPPADIDGGRYMPALRGRRVVWTVNDFPYAMAPGVEHHVLWSDGPLTRSQLCAVASAEREGYKWGYFVNPPSLQSVREIWHAHVLSVRGQPPGCALEGGGRTTPPRHRGLPSGLREDT
ncbi:unnamed protein product [Pedinophyceae sp. YPF-701]|nr:unnamed protein product [Pedinophyceae sp. YPF-701]